MSVTDATVHYLDLDGRGREVPRKLDHKGQKMTISRDAREHGEEMRPDGPFVNGMLKCLTGERATADQPGKTDEELMQLAEAYRADLAALLMDAPKLTVSRLRQMATSEEFGERFTSGMTAAVKKVWQTRWPQRDVPEMQLEGILEDIQR